MIFEISLPVFLLVTVVLGGGAAYMAGRSLAREWQPWPRMTLYLLLLCAAVRFIHFSLFDGTFFLPTSGFATAGYYFIVDFIVLMAIGWLSRRLTRAGQMSTQYSFLYRRSGPLGWRQR